MSLVPRGFPGADRESSCQPGDLGQQRVPHLLVRLSRTGQCRSEYLRGRGPAAATTTSAESDSAPSAGLVVVAVHSCPVPVRRALVARDEAFELAGCVVAGDTVDDADFDGGVRHALASQCVDD